MKSEAHIEIVSSSVTGLSSMSAISRQALCVSLSAHYTDVRITLVNNQADLNQLVGRKPDLVFLGMKFLPVHPDIGFLDKNKIWLSDVLDENDITYTGSTRSAHELEVNKHLAKECVKRLNLHTSPFFYVEVGAHISEDDMVMAYPLFVKPSNRGGGMGIDDFSLVRNYAELSAKVANIHNELGSPALIEQYLPGREFSVAILKSKLDDSYSVMPIELIAPIDSRGVRVLSEDVKAADAESVLEVVDVQLMHKLAELGLAVFHALGARDYGRVDIRLDREGKPLFLEANLIPSIIEGYGSFPKACVLAQNMDYDSMTMHIVELALLRTSSVSVNEIEEYEVLELAVAPV